LILTAFLLLFDFFIFEKWCKCTVPSKSNKQKNFIKNIFLLTTWRSMTKIAGFGYDSGSGSISQRRGSADLDPDPESGSTPKCHGSATLVLRYRYPICFGRNSHLISWGDKSVVSSRTCFFGTLYMVSERGAWIKKSDLLVSTPKFRLV
jgi:hypothetical protein